MVFFDQKFKIPTDGYCIKSNLKLILGLEIREVIKNIFYILVVEVSFCFTACQKQYTCVCLDAGTGEKNFEDQVKTTHLGKKGFEKSCKSKSNDKKDCYVE